MSQQAKSRITSENQSLNSIGSVFGREQQHSVTSMKEFESEDKRLTKAIKDNEKDAQKKKELEAERNELRKKDRNTDYLSHSDSLIEYDSVVNQMLLQYEQGSKDRDSEYYRKLKAAALSSHVKRHNQKLKK